MNKQIPVLLLLQLCFSCKLVLGQDTIFVTKHQFPKQVRNVFVTGNVLYAKTGDGLYKRENNQWELQEMEFQKAFVFYNNGFYEADYIPNPFIFDARSMAALIPQRSLVNGTLARIDNHLFVSVGGSLFEYSINNYYKHYYQDCSIRDIYIEKDLKVISTYSGIFINDTIKAASPSYSNGCFARIKGNYYLSADSLYLYTAPAIFKGVPAGTNLFAGYSRKLIEYQTNIFALNTKSVNQFDSIYGLRPIHQGFEYYDFETVDSLLLFCTSTGEVFKFNGQTSQLLFKLNTRIRDIYSYKQTLYFSTDEGVYTMLNMQANTLKLLLPLKLSVKVIIDVQNNTWIATENGLFVLPPTVKEPIEFIQGVEFNRGALTNFGDEIYAGSIEGLYVINVYAVIKNFLPLYLNKKSLDESAVQKRLLVIVSLTVALLLLAGYFVYKRRRKISFASTEKKDKPALTLEKIGEDIRTHNIMTVEGLAEYYKTNTVQLNREFKTFNNTPGKFMKQVKLGIAKELLKQDVPIEVVATKTGYSENYLKKELNL